MDLRFIGERSIPAATLVDGDPFGGISGIDYDPRDGKWFLVSDDRSERAPARFFVAAMSFDATGVRDVVLESARHFGADAVDAESIRVESDGKTLLVGGEGDAQKQIAPWLRRFDRSGNFVDELHLPQQLRTGEHTGPRPNRSIEGIAFDAGNRALWIAMEAPLLQDGAVATVDHGADIRLTHVSLDGRRVSQYVYRTDTARAANAGESSDLGVSEILVLDARRLLVLERSGVGAAGRFRFRTRLYCADLARATDVVSIGSLSGSRYRIAAKQLLLDFDSLDAVVPQNLEAMSWGPSLASGQRSLVLASDNNFFPGVPTQLLFFAIR
jgi:hypothetical protein